jgi:GTPase SAR1 family protein
MFLWSMFKPVVVGDPGGGQTQMTRRFVDNKINPSRTPTTGIDLFCTMWSLIACWTSFRCETGQEQCRTITKSYFRDADGAVIV